MEKLQLVQTHAAAALSDMGDTWIVLHEQAKSTKDKVTEEKFLLLSVYAWYHTMKYMHMQGRQLLINDMRVFLHTTVKCVARGHTSIVYGYLNHVPVNTPLRTFTSLIRFLRPSGASCSSPFPPDSPAS